MTTDDERRFRSEQAKLPNAFVRSSPSKRSGLMEALRCAAPALPGGRGAEGEAFAPFFTVTPTEADPVPAVPALTRRRLGALTLVGLAAPAPALRRTPEMAAGQGLDALLVLFPLDGEARVTWPEGSAALGRLQGVVLDLARPAAITAGLRRASGLVLPRGLVADRVPNLERLHGTVLDPHASPIDRLFFTCIAELAEAADAPTADQLPQVTRAVATLCAAALRAACPAPTPRRADLAA